MSHILTNDGPHANDATLTGTTNIDEIQFNTSHTPAVLVDGKTYWDATDRTLSTVLDAAKGVVLQHGQEAPVRCANKTGAQINDGQVVYIDDAQGNRPTCSLSLANSHLTSRVIGVATQDIANNAEGFVTTFGIVRGFNTSGFTDGDKLFLSAVTPGALTNVEPSSPNLVVCVGIALNSTPNGSIFVNPQPAIDADDSFTGATNLVAPGQLAVKNFVGQEILSNLATATPLADFGTGTVGVATKSAREDHVHPASAGSSGAALRVLNANMALSAGYSYVICGPLETNGYILDLNGATLGVI